MGPHCQEEIGSSNLKFQLKALFLELRNTVESKKIEIMYNVFKQHYDKTYNDVTYKKLLITDATYNVDARLPNDRPLQALGHGKIPPDKVVRLG